MAEVLILGRITESGNRHLSYFVNAPSSSGPTGYAARA
jgi:hypothetical protein